MEDGTVTATRFKSDCLKLVEEVYRDRKTVTVTRHGKPVAKLVPVEQLERRPVFGCMKGTVSYDSDDDLIDPPIDSSEWEAMR